MLALLLVALFSAALTGAQVPGAPPGGEVLRGEQEQDVESREIRGLAWKAAQKVTEGANGVGDYHWIPVKVESATKQLVTGLLYRLTVIMAQSGCTKNEVWYY